MVNTWNRVHHVPLKTLFKGEKHLKHLSALIVKYVMTAVILEIALLLLSDAGFGSILLISLIVTAISYIIGDMIILPATNNIIATIADMGLAAVTIYLCNFIWNNRIIPFLSALVSGVVLGVGEYFFHKIIDRSIDEDDITE